MIWWPGMKNTIWIAAVTLIVGIVLLVFLWNRPKPGPGDQGPGHPKAPPIVGGHPPPPAKPPVPGVALPKPPPSGPTPQEARIVAREMVKAIGQCYLGTKNQKDLKAYFDQIQRLGPAAIPALAEILAGSEPQEMRLAALNALEGLRAAARDFPYLLKDGQSVADIARLKGIPVETVQATLDAGDWDEALTTSMAGAAWSLLQTTTVPEFRSGAVSSLYGLADSSPAALNHLIEFARTPGGDAALRAQALEFAGSRMKPAEAGPLTIIAADPSMDVPTRLKAGIAWAKAVKGEGDSADRDRMASSVLPLAATLMRDPSVPGEQRGSAIELYGRVEGERAHPELVRMLDTETSDPVRTAAMGTLVETGGLAAARASIERIAAEPKPSGAKALATRLLKIMPR